MRRPGLLFATVALSLALPAGVLAQTTTDLDLRMVLSAASRGITARATYRIDVPKGIAEVRFRANRMAINLVTLDGADGAFFQEDALVRVPVPDSGGVRTVTLVYETRPMAGVRVDPATPMIHSDGIPGLVSYWLPLPEEAAPPTAPVSFVLVVPKAWQAVAPGEPKERTDEGYDRIGWRYRQDRPVRFDRLRFAAGPMTETLTGSNPPVGHWSPPLRQREADALFGSAGRIAAFFARFLDIDPPEGRLAFVLVPELPPTPVGTSGAGVELLDGLRADEVPLRIAARWFVPKPGAEPFAHSLHAVLAAFWRRESEGVDRFDAARWPEEPEFDRWFRLHRTAGETRFRSALGRLSRTPGGIDEAAARAAFSAEGVRWPAAPPFVTLTRDAKGRSVAMATAAVTLPVLVDGTEKSVRLGTTPTVLPAGKRIVVDPGGWKTGGITITDPRYDGEGAFYAASGVLGRIRILRALPAEKRDAVLVRTLPAVRAPGLLRAMLGTTNDLRLYAPYLVHPDPGLRGDAVYSMTRLDPKVAAPLVTAARKTVTDPAIGQELDGLLLRVVPSRELAEATWRDPAGDRAAVLVAWERLDPNRARDEAYGLAVAPPSMALKRAALRTLGRVKDAPGERRVFDTLVTVARDPGVWTRVAALEALGDYGAPEVRPTLEALVDHPWAVVAEAARAALYRLPKA